jgi:hypothetical protein
MLFRAKLVAPMTRITSIRETFFQPLAEQWPVQTAVVLSTLASLILPTIGKKISATDHKWLWITTLIVGCINFAIFKSYTELSWTINATASFVIAAIGLKLADHFSSRPMLPVPSPLRPPAAEAPPAPKAANPVSETPAEKKVRVGQKNLRAAKTLETLLKSLPEPPPPSPSKTPTTRREASVQRLTQEKKRELDLIGNCQKFLQGKLSRAEFIAALPDPHNPPHSKTLLDDIRAKGVDQPILEEVTKLVWNSNEYKVSIQMKLNQNIPSPAPSPRVELNRFSIQLQKRRNLIEIAELFIHSHYHHLIPNFATPPHTWDMLRDGVEFVTMKSAKLHVFAFSSMPSDPLELFVWVLKLHAACHKEIDSFESYQFLEKDIEWYMEAVVHLNTLLEASGKMDINLSQPLLQRQIRLKHLFSYASVATPTPSATSAAAPTPAAGQAPVPSVSRRLFT